MLFNFEGTVKAALSATCGDNSEEVPPVPIPNTVVKLLSADDTWGVTLWEIRTSPLFSFFVKISIGYSRYRSSGSTKGKTIALEQLQGCFLFM